MELTKCSLCFIKFSPKPHYSEVTIKSEEVLDQNNYYGAEERDADSISNQLKIIFLLRKILEIPQNKCCDFLVDYGDPCSWMKCCPSCSGLVEKGKTVFDQMTLLQNQFKKLQNEIKRTIISSGCDNDGEDEKSKWGVRETVRSFIGQGAPDLIIASRKDERTVNTIYSEIPGPISLSSDVVETLHPWNEVGEEDHNISYEADNVSFGDQDPLALGEKDDANDEQFVNNFDAKKETEFCYLIKNEGVMSNDELDAPKGEKSSRFVNRILDQVNTQTGNKTYKYVISGKGFKPNWELVKHQKTHTGEKLYECEFCKKRFTDHSKLKRHERCQAREKPYQCKFCEKTFRESNVLKQHERIHTEEKPYGCRFCEKRFAKGSSLKVHERRHTGEKPYQCTFCEKCFSQSSELKSHERNHTGEKRYQCAFCEKSFSHSSTLKDHERIHTGEKPYQCSYCEKTFATQSSLKQHERTHTGEKPYQCRYCGKRFIQQSCIKTHERTHTGEKPYGCRFCEKRFAGSRDLKRHERNHTGKESLCYE